MTRGRKPLPSHLRLIEGTHRDDRHGSTLPTAQPAGRKPPIRPARMSKGAIAAWQQFIEPAFWLDWSRTVAAAAFCELWAEFRASPSRFPSAKHTQMRGYLSDLGLTDARRRVVVGNVDKNEFFDD